MLEASLIAALAACVVFAAILAIAEVSLMRVRRSAVFVDAEAGDRRARQLLALLDDFPVALNAVLLAVLTVQVLAATISGYLAQRWLGGVGVTVATVLLTAVLFVYGEAVPKTVAVRSPDRWARRLTPLVRWVTRICRPAVSLLVRLADLQSPGHDPMVGALTEAELRALARESAELGTIEEDDAELVERSFVFGDTTLADVMVPRSQIASIDGDAPIDEVLAAAIASGHRRFPVCGDGIDDVIGMVRLRDLSAADAAGERLVTRDVMSDVLRCGPDDPIAAVLERMQAADRWLAIVGDVAGRTLGLVTIEDIVAELVGEITDDRDTPTTPT